MDSFSLKGNYPNPFNPETTISYTLNTDSEIFIGIYNISGQKVEELLNTHQSSENYSVTCNASEYPSGMYVFRLSDYSNTLTHKIMLIK